MKLNNGSPVVRGAVHPGSVGQRAWVGKVIAHLPDNDLHPYVVWGVASDDGEHFDAFSGTYCETIEQAQEAFDNRRG